MKLNLQRPLSIFDLEATGLVVSQDRIVEIAIIKIHPDGTEEHFSSRVNPTIPIPQEVSAIHGITDEMVKDCPTFADLAERITNFIGDSDLGGYNSNKFDIPMLAEELIRANSSFDMSARKFVDVQNIFHKMEQRTLAAAVQFYCKQDLENSHTAMADTQATWDVLKAQLDRYPDLKPDIDFLADFTQVGNGKMVDFAGRLLYNEDGDVIYNFGKHKGKTIEAVLKQEPGYYGWFVSDSTDFPQYTKFKLKEAMENLKEKRRQEKEPKEDNTSIEDKLAALQNKFKK